MTASYLPIFPVLPPVLVVFLPCIHPHLEARLLSNPDHTCIQSQTLKLYRRLGGRFDWRFSTGSLLFLTGSLAGFSTLLRPFFCCAAAATHQFSLLFLTIFLLVPGSSAGSPPCVCYCATTYTLTWRRACFQTRTTRASNHRHSSCIDDLEAALTADILPFPAGFPPVLRPACATARQRTPSPGGAPAFKPGPHVHPITDTQAVSTTWRPL